MWVGLALAMSPAEIEAALDVDPMDVSAPYDVEIVTLERDLPAPKLAVHLVLTGSAWTLDGEALEQAPHALLSVLQEKAETAKTLASMAGPDFAFQGELLVTATPDIPASTLTGVFEAAHEASFPRVRMVVATGQAPERPLADPVYGAELRERLAAMSGVDRMRTVSNELQVMGSCPAAVEVLDSVARASAELKQQVLRKGLAQALPTCEGLDVKKVVTAWQVMNEPGPPLGVLAVDLDPTGTRHQLDPASPWKSLAPWWADQPPGPTWWWVSEERVVEPPPG